MAGDREEFAQRLRRLRKKAGLTQEKLAEFAEVSYITARRWEAGERTPRVEEVKRIAEALHVTEAELLNGPERQEWVLKIRVSIDPKEEEIDMTEGGCISNLDLTRKGAALTLGADYATFEDEGKFESLINQLRAARNMVIENGRRIAAINAAAATA
ncbi:MAG: helix-turn-helix transcriptional regulator [Fretibacterium sp.]|nr:helix-turn-helix transcriptional regulator [Fretibacterium sp.]